MKPFKGFGALSIVLGGCKWFLATTSIPILFIRIFLTSTTGFWEPE